MVASVGTILIDPQDGDMADYLRSLKQLHELEARQLIPAHGFVVTNPKAILEHYVEHRLSREIKVMQALTSTPKSLSDLVPRVYADTPTNLHNLAQRSLLAHLVKLQTEGRCIRHGESWSQCK